MSHGEIARADETSETHQLFCKQFQSYRQQSTSQRSIRHFLGEGTIKKKHTAMWYTAPGKKQCGDQHKDWFTKTSELHEQ